MYLIVLSGNKRRIPLFIVEDYAAVESCRDKMFYRVIFPKLRNPLLCVEAYEPQSPTERDALVLDNIAQLIDIKTELLGEGKDWDFISYITFTEDGVIKDINEGGNILYIFNALPVLIPKYQNFIYNVFSDGCLVTSCKTVDKAMDFCNNILYNLGWGKAVTWVKVGDKRCKSYFNGKFLGYEIEVTEVLE